MSTDTRTTLTLSRVVPATPDAAFRAWTEAEHLRRWACPEGATVDAVSVDLRPGGAYRIRMVGEDGSVYTAFGTYREIQPPNRVVYTWDWEEADHAMGETLVTVVFNRLGQGTEVVLTHERFPSAEATEAHHQGWTSCLGRYEALFGGA